jgi:hypothetical protein
MKLLKIKFVASTVIAIVMLLAAGLPTEAAAANGKLVPNPITASYSGTYSFTFKITEKLPEWTIYNVWVNITAKNLTPNTLYYVGFVDYYNGSEEMNAWAQYTAVTDSKGILKYVMPSYLTYNYSTDGTWQFKAYVNDSPFPDANFELTGTKEIFLASKR